jgi:putative ABC transport system permease protein
MFFITYLRRELRRRTLQAIFIALGLALGVGLVITVAAASAGFNKAQSDVLSALYGAGTDVTVTGASGPPPGVTPIRQFLQPSPHGWVACNSNGNGKCTNLAGTTQDNMNAAYNGFSASKVAEAARLNGVAAAAGGLSLLDQWQKWPKSGTALPPSGSYWVDGVDIGHLSLGPLSGATIAVGHSFTAADSDADVALVDSGYAKANGLKVGSTLAIHQVTYTVIGIVSQPQDGNPTDIYLPLARTQAMTLHIGSAVNEVNTIYLAAASAADIPAVSKEISALLPGTTVTTAGSLSSQVSASVGSAEKLVNDLGRWLSVLVLIAAFAAACLLTMAAVTRRVGEFGTLRALGWRPRRIVAAGIGLGFAGAAIIATVVPKASATVGGNDGPQVTGPPGSPPPKMIGGASMSHPVTVPVHPSVSVSLIILAVILAIAGGLLAGAFGGWRIARLRPADALARVA